jgi:hypothetical protein
LAGWRVNPKSLGAGQLAAPQDDDMGQIADEAFFTRCGQSLQAEPLTVGASAHAALGYPVLDRLTWRFLSRYDQNLSWAMAG